MRTRRIVVSATMFAILVISSGISWADDQFDDRSLRGTWGFSASGRVFVPTPSPATPPAAAVGLIIADGSGNCVTRARLNLDGVVVSLVSTACTYEVNADGTGQIRSSFGPISFLTDFVIIEARKEFHFIVSDDPNRAPGTVANGVAKRQQGGND